MLEDQVRAFLEQWAETEPPLLTPQDRLVLGVSGGADSLALLHLLAVAGLHPRGNLVVGHLDHALRPASAAEAQFVARRCEAWGVACHVARVDVAALARGEGLSLEEAGRVARYRFLARLARRVGAPAVAVAHHADDQVETVLMHFLRGSGLAGLRGMAPAAPLAEAPELTLLRPLLSSGRAEIEAYCARHELEPLTDFSNEDTTFFRNRIRHELVPLLQQYNPQIRERLQQLAAIASADYELLQGERAKAWAEITLESGPEQLRVDLASWQALPLSLRRLTLRHAVRQLCPSVRDVGFRAVELARDVAEKGEVGAQATLPGGLVLTVGYEAWRLATEEAAPAPAPPQLPPGAEEPLRLPVPGRVALTNGWSLEASRVEALDLARVMANPDPWLAFVDAAQAGELVVRARRRGERFQPLGMEGQSTKVADVMINEKIPARARSRWPIIGNGSHLVWLAGVRLDERVRITAATKSVFELRCVRHSSRRSKER